MPVPTDPDIAVALEALQARRGRIDRAIRALEALVEDDPLPKVIAFAARESTPQRVA